MPAKHDTTPSDTTNPKPTQVQDANTDSFTLVRAKKKKTQRRVTLATTEEMDADTNPEETNTATETIPPSTTPEDPVAIDIQRECRYQIIISVPASTEPWKDFTDLLKKFLKSLQDQTTKKLFIASWDPDLASPEPLIKKATDFPEGSAKKRMKYVNYFSGYPNPKRGKPSNIYLQVRFVTNAPQDMPFELENMGHELSECIQEEMRVFLAKKPYACQAIKPECIGWFFGSTKSIDSKKLVPAIKTKLNIPNNIAVGLQWRTIKMENGCKFPWSEEEKFSPKPFTWT
jgi:hypothetical protein